MSRSLLRAEALMEEHPDSALAILDSIPPADIRSDADRALHALLLTQARIKNGYAVDGDSLINVAVGYYSGSGDSPRLMKSLFYKGKVEFNCSDLPAAIVPAMRARDLAIRYDDDYWRAKAAELIADIYSIMHYKYEAIEHTEEAVEYYKRAGKIDNHRFSLCDLAIDRSNNRLDDNKNVELIDSVLGLAKSHPTDSALVLYCDEALLPMYIDLGKNKEAKQTLDELFSLKKFYSPDSKQYSYMAQLALNSGDETDAIRKIEKADSAINVRVEKVNIYVFYRDYFKRKGMYRQAEAYTDSILALQNEEVTEVLRQSVVAVQRDYFNEKADKETNKAKASAVAAIVLGTLLAAVCLGFWLYYRERMRRKQSEIDNRMSEILALTERITIQEMDIEALTSSVNEKNNKPIPGMDSDMRMELLFKKQWDTLNMLCNEYLEAGDSHKERTDISKNIEREIDKLRSPKKLKRIEKSVNEYMDGILSRLKSQCPFLKDTDTTFLMLIYAGFAPRAVCLFTGTSIKNFYAKRSRLRKRIEESDAKDKELFISRMS